MKKAVVQVQVYMPPEETEEAYVPTAFDKVRVLNLPENVEEEFLEMYFESKQFEGAKVVSVDFNEEAGTAVITFDNQQGKLFESSK